MAKLVLLVLAALAVFPVAKACPLDLHTAQVADISGPEYFPAVCRALASAKSSIKVVMYLMEASGNMESRVNRLIDELIAARKRGARVEVVLDQQYGGLMSERAFGRLFEAGIRVSYDSRPTTTHAKTIIIDNRLVIMGSANWSETALGRSVEASVLIDSPELAASLSKYFQAIELDPAVDISNFPEPERTSGGK